ncbi:MAG: Ig-like domain-containing protein [Actinomycetota bacterium]
MSVLALCAVAMAGSLARADACATCSVTITSPSDGDHVFNATWVDTVNPVLTTAGVGAAEDTIIHGTSTDAVSISIDLSNHGIVKRGDYVKTVAPAADGTWTVDPGLLLPDTYTLTATATDALGNTTDTSIQIAVIA